MVWGWGTGSQADVGSVAEKMAVVDVETTGLHPGRHHRIVEIAVVHPDRAGDDGEWSTLVDPGQDLGDASIHGIRGRDLEGAPTFSDVAGEVLDRLGGRVLVAHNARFDRGFIEAELGRAGYDVSPIPSLCTIDLAHQVGLTRGGARLDECCGSVGIPIADRHQALGDARLCAALLSHLLEMAFSAGVASVGELGFPEPRPLAEWPRGPTSEAPAKHRGDHDWSQHFLSGLVESREVHPREHQSSTHARYVAMLDRALEDRRLTDEEEDDLRSIATELAIPIADLRGIHDAYLDGVCAAAVEDGVVTDRERYDLELVAELLGCGDLEDRLARQAGEPLLQPAPRVADGDSLAGKSVCFTGKLLCRVDGYELTREDATGLAEAAGLITQRGVTKKLDLLVVADPLTNSGKAKKAREYGVRVMAETEFWRKIGVDVE